MSKSKIRLKWLSCACYEIEIDGKTILTDPFITDNPDSPCSVDDVEGCDIMTLSHGHYDHITDFPVLVKRYPETPILCGPLTAMPLVKWLDCDPMFVYPVESNLELDFDWVKVKALFGHHNDLRDTFSGLCKRLDENPISQKFPDMHDLNAVGNLEYRNFLFTAPDGRKILIWGSRPTVDMLNMISGLGADIAILQRNKRDPAQLARFAKATGAKVILPHHMDLHEGPEGYLPSVEQTRDEYSKIAPDGRFIIPEHNVWYEF